MNALSSKLDRLLANAKEYIQGARDIAPTLEMYYRLDAMCREIDGLLESESYPVLRQASGR